MNGGHPVLLRRAHKSTSLQGARERFFPSFFSVSKGGGGIVSILCGKIQVLNFLPWLALQYYYSVFCTPR